MKHHDKFTKPPFNITEPILYTINLKEIDNKAKISLEHLSYKEMKRGIKLFKNIRRDIEVICEFTGEVMYSHYESFRVHNDKPYRRKHGKFIEQHLKYDTSN